MQIKTAIIFQEKYLNKKQLKIMDTINKPNKCPLVVQLYPTLCDPIDCSPSGSSVHGMLQAQEYWSRLPFPTPGHLPVLGIEPASPVLSAKSLQSHPTLCDPINYSLPGFSVHGIL